jgi:hypothetical protein
MKSVSLLTKKQLLARIQENYDQPNEKPLLFWIFGPPSVGHLFGLNNQLSIANRPRPSSNN